jgi:hypothetical protein
MKKVLAVVVTALFLVVCIGAAFAAQKAPQKVTDLAPKLAKFGTDKVIVEAVKAQNAKGETVEKAKEMDKKWKATPGVADFMKAEMDSNCGKRLQEIRKSESYFEELFVMDSIGSNVCITNKTTSYWRGDNDKFTKAYNSGKGGTYIGDLKFDDSSQSYIVQVSVPVKDGDKAIGTITFGINPDKIK